MTPEELMRPRYKVIADYPGMSFKIGNTLTYCKTGRDSGWYNESGQSYETCVDFPHLFKKLEWWEERKPEEMPEYVKFQGKVCKIKEYVFKEWFSAFYTDDVKFGVIKHINQTTPATESEYLSYKNENQ